MTGPTDPRDDEVAAELERYAARGTALPSEGFAERVMEAVAAEPLPRRGLLAWLLVGQPLGRLARAGLVTAALVLLVAGTMFAGQAVGLFPDVGASGTPSPTPSPTLSEPAEPTSDESVEPTEAESADPTPTASARASQVPRGSASGVPSASSSADDSGSASPTESGSETPSASPSATPSATPKPSASP